jgi:hypothetical protein
MKRGGGGRANGSRFRMRILRLVLRQTFRADLWQGPRLVHREDGIAAPFALAIRKLNADGFALSDDRKIECSSFFRGGFETK